MVDLQFLWKMTKSALILKYDRGFKKCTNASKERITSLETCGICEKAGEKVQSLVLAGKKLSPGCVFTILHFLRNLGTDPIS